MFYLPQFTFYTEYLTKGTEALSTLWGQIKARFCKNKTSSMLMSSGAHEPFKWYFLMQYLNFIGLKIDCQVVPF